MLNFGHWFSGARARLTRYRMGSEAILALPNPAADIRVAYDSAPSNFGDLRIPRRNGPHPVALFIHGGYWRARYDLEHIGHLCAALTESGLATWNIEYRRIGNPGGGWPGTFLDIASAASYLQILAPQYDLDLERVIVIGHSAGGQLALWLAGLHRVAQTSAVYAPAPIRLRAVCGLAPVSDLKYAWELHSSSGVLDELLGSPEQYPDRYAAVSPRELVPLGVRQFLFHGTRDQDVPFEMSERYRQAARAVGDEAELVPFAGLGHFELIDPQSLVWPTLLETVNACI